MLRCIAIDDEPIALDVIRRLAVHVPSIRLEATFTDPFAAIAYLEKHGTDLLFLDIRMPDLSGLQLLAGLNPKPLTIMTTAHSEHAVQSFELDVVDYLLKPYSQERFTKACEKSKELFEYRNRINDDDAVFVKSGYEQVKIKLADLLYVQSAGNYVQFITTAGKILSRMTMNDAMGLLPSQHFKRIHRSYIVGMKHVDRVEKSQVSIGSVILPVGPEFAT